MVGFGEYDNPSNEATNIGMIDMNGKFVYVALVPVDSKRF